MTVHDSVDEIVSAFLDFALYYQNNQFGVPLCNQYYRHELPQKLIASAYADVLNFASEVRKRTRKNFDPAQLGVDFYFARNEGLTGFWDKTKIYGEYAQLLQEIAEKYPPFIIDFNE
jgi:hypothetical protein